MKKGKLFEMIMDGGLIMLFAFSCGALGYGQIECAKDSNVAWAEYVLSVMFFGMAFFLTWLTVQYVKNELKKVK